MPLYEYECMSCGSRREKLRPVRERAHKLTCNVSNCGGRMLPTITTPATPVMDPVKPVVRPKNL